MASSQGPRLQPREPRVLPPPRPRTTGQSWFPTGSLLAPPWGDRMFQLALGRDRGTWGITGYRNGGSRRTNVKPWNSQLCSRIFSCINTPDTGTRSSILVQCCTGTSRRPEFPSAGVDLRLIIAVPGSAQLRCARVRCRGGLGEHQPCIALHHDERLAGKLCCGRARCLPCGTRRVSPPFLSLDKK